jgi:hypothetical protein
MSPVSLMNDEISVLFFEGPEDRRTGGPEDRRTGGPEDRRTGGRKSRFSYFFDDKNLY